LARRLIFGDIDPGRLCKRHKKGLALGRLYGSALGGVDSKIPF